MLVLGRKVGESVVVGDGTMVTILEVRGDKVRLGFDAPRSLPIYRYEICPHELRERHTDKTAPPAELPAAEMPKAG